MAHYIDADRLRAEIEQLLEFDGTVKTDYYIGKRDAELVILSFLDSLQQEQPEVDLEKEVERWKNKRGVVGMDDLWIKFARYFYKLGRKTKKNRHDYFTPQAVTDIYNAGRNDVLKDLPRWRKCEKPFDSPSNCGYNGVNLINHGYALSIDDAYTKLPKDE